MIPVRFVPRASDKCFWHCNKSATNHTQHIHFYENWKIETFTGLCDSCAKYGKDCNDCSKTVQIANLRASRID